VLLPSPSASPALVAVIAKSGETSEPRVCSYNPAVQDSNTHLRLWNLPRPENERHHQRHATLPHTTRRDTQLAGETAGSTVNGRRGGQAGTPFSIRRSIYIGSSSKLRKTIKHMTDQLVRNAILSKQADSEVAEGQERERPQNARSGMLLAVYQQTLVHDHCHSLAQRGVSRRASPSCPPLSGPGSSSTPRIRHLNQIHERCEYAPKDIHRSTRAISRGNFSGWWLAEKRIWDDRGQHRLNVCVHSTA